MTERSAAVLTIKDSAKMTKAGRRRIAQWLVAQADFLVQYGHDYTDRYRARYMYVNGKPVTGTPG